MNGTTPMNVRFATLELLIKLPLNQENDLPLIQTGLLEALQKSSLWSAHLELLLLFLKSRMQEALPKFLDIIVAHNDFRKASCQVVFLKNVYNLKSEWIPHLLQGLLVRPEFLSRLNASSLEVFRDFFVEKGCWLEITLIEYPDENEEMSWYYDHAKITFAPIIPYLTFEDIKNIFEKLITIFPGYYAIEGKIKYAILSIVKQLLILSPTEITNVYFPHLESYYPREKFHELYIPLYRQEKLGEQGQKAYRDFFLEGIREDIKVGYVYWMSQMIETCSPEEFDTCLTALRASNQSNPKGFKFKLADFYGDFASRLENGQQINDAFELLKNTKNWKLFFKLSPRMNNTEVLCYLQDFKDWIEFDSKHFMHDSNIGIERKILFCLHFFAESGPGILSKLQMIIFLMKEKSAYNDKMVAEALTIKLTKLNTHYVEAKNKAYHPQGFFASICTNDDWNRESNNHKEEANKLIREYEIFFSDKKQVDMVLKACANMPLFEEIESPEITKWKINVGWLS